MIEILSEYSNLYFFSMATTVPLESSPVTVSLVGEKQTAFNKVTLDELNISFSKSTVFSQTYSGNRNEIYWILKGKGKISKKKNSSEITHSGEFDNDFGINQQTTKFKEKPRKKDAILSTIKIGTKITE